MALKDWKKNTKFKSGKLEWIRNDKKDYLVYDYENYKYHEYRHFVWNQRNTTNKSFKTKAQALAFAKTYMRTH
jgi:hypothetical protein